MAPSRLPPPLVMPDSASSASTAVTNEALSTSPTSLATPKNNPSSPLGRPRTYKTKINDPDREGEEAEREFADFGGDVPEDRVMVKRMARKNTINRGRSLSRTISGNALPFPDLHLVDSAFSDAHRVRSRAFTIVNEGSGEVIVVTEEEPDLNQVQWYEDDPENPQNWSNGYKWFVIGLCSFLTVNVTFASTAPSSATVAIADAFNTTIEISTLGTSLFLFGYVFGPLCGGVVADIFDVIGRGPAMSAFTASVFLGPVIGPIIGGYVTESYLGWRWVFWVMMIFGGLCWVLVVAFLPETYAPVLLAKRAKKMRREEPEKHKDVYAALEQADFSLKSIVGRTLGRPFIMLAVEPILLLVTIYLSVIYGLLYALFSVFPIIWSELRGFSNGLTGLVFIGVGIGTTMGAVLNIIVQRHYKVLAPKWHGHVPPEERLIGAMLAGPLLIIGIFMLGWTGQFASIPWWVPGIATIFLGMSFTLVFISFLSYIIEVYLMYAASALAANTIVRSAVAGAFPLFIDQMFRKLGVGGACSLIGGLAIVIAPSPFIFYKYGARIRQGSRFAPCLDIHMRETVEREEREELEKKSGVAV